MSYTSNSLPVFRLGSLSFRTSHQVSNFREHSPNRRNHLPDEVHYILNHYLGQLQERLRQEFGVPFVIQGGSVSPGSIIFRDGEIVVKSRTIAALLVLYGFIGNYPDLREGAIALTNDIGGVLADAAAYIHASEFEYTPPDPERLAYHIDLAMPPAIRRKLERLRHYR